MKRLARAALTLAVAFSPMRAFAASPGAAIDIPVLPAPPAMTGTVDESWSKAARISLDMDFTYRRPATEPTTVYVGQENGYLDVAFAATQNEPVTATQVTNGASVQNDDYVEVALNPQGTHGFSYTFYANPHGARFQTSSENTAYSPQWTAVTSRTPKGYVVTMRIPLRVIRGGGSTAWRAQFMRYIVASNGLSVWTYSAQASSIADASFYGVLRNVGAHAPGKTRPQPRAQPYALGQLTPRAYGGNTSRVGLDASVPFTPTASFLASLHPDYSNVEIDQQTIAPTAFVRQYTEVRPFFTQLSSFIDNTFACLNCPQALYTPSIPVFSQGYAIEGTQGPMSFMAFDAIGDARSDDAQSATFTEQDTNRIIDVSVQRADVDTPSLVDDTTTITSGYMNQHSHFALYFNAGMDRGTLVTDPREANYFEGGPLYITSTSTVGISYQRIGAQYDPVDGYVAQPNIAGYESIGRHTWNFSPHDPLHDIVASAGYSRYGNDQNQLAQTLGYGQVNLDFRNFLTGEVYAQSEGVRASTGEFLPFNANGFLLGYHVNSGAQSSGSASSTGNTPTYVSYTAGPYYHGDLDAWTYLTTLPLARHFQLALETDEDRYDTQYSGESGGTQWLERASLDWQINPFTEFDVGLRRIVGPNLPNAFQTLGLASPQMCFTDPYYPGCNVVAGNVSVAFHFLAARNEFYVVYGDPNDLSTYPALIVKWIRYIGAEKGT